MSLICAQEKKDIIFGEPLYAACIGKTNYALSQAAVDLLPVECQQDSSTVKVGSPIFSFKEGTADRNFNGSYASFFIRRNPM